MVRDLIELWPHHRGGTGQRTVMQVAVLLLFICMNAVAAWAFPLQEEPSSPTVSAINGNAVLSAGRAYMAAGCNYGNTNPTIILTL